VEGRLALKLLPNKARQGARWRTTDPKVQPALDTFEPLLFNNVTLALDRYFVHRLRMVTGKDGNALERLSNAFFAEIESKFVQ
jgi:hypothetical protein